MAGPLAVVSSASGGLPRGQQQRMPPELDQHLPAERFAQFAAAELADSADQSNSTIIMRTSILLGIWPPRLPAFGAA
jgi:hypothetical protein